MFVLNIVTTVYMTLHHLYIDMEHSVKYDFVVFFKASNFISQ